MKTISFLILISMSGLFAQTSWTGITSTQWANSANWTNGVPGSSADATIGDASFTGAYQPNISSDATCKSLTLGNAAKVSTLTMNKLLTVSGSLTIGSNGTLTHSQNKISLTGNWSNSGTYNATNNNSTVVFAGTSQTLTGTTTFKRLTINSGSSTTLSSGITISKGLVVSGILDPGTNLVTFSSGSTFSVTSNATIKVKNATFALNYSSNPTLDAASTVEYASALIDQTVAVLTYGTLKITGATIKTPAGNVSLSSANTTTGNVNLISGTLDLAGFTLNRAATGGGTFTLANGSTLKIGGTNTFPINYLTYNIATTNTVHYYGNNQTVASQLYGNLTLSTTSGAVTKTLPATALVIANDLVSTLGTGTSLSFTAASNFTVNGNATIGASTTFNGGSYSHTFAGNLTNNGTLSGGTGTITLSGTNKILAGTTAPTFFNLNISGYGVTASTTSITIAGNLSTTNPGTFVHSAGGTLTMTGASKFISGTDITLDNLSVSGSVTTTASPTLTGNLTLNSLATLSASAGTFRMTGAAKTIASNGTLSFYGLRLSGTISTASNFNVSSDLTGTGKLTATAGTITFNGTSAFTGSHDLFNVVLNGTKLQLSTDAVLGIGGTLTLTAGTFDVTSTTPNTVNYNANGNQTTTSTTYNNISFSTGGTKSVTAGITVNNILTIGTGATFNAGTFTHSVLGNWVNNGSFTPSTSTIQLTGTADVTTTGATTFNILTINKSASSNFITLNNNISVATLNMTSGDIYTGSNAVIITNTRTGNGKIIGTITRTHAFGAAISYAFESPYNTIDLSSITGSISSITVIVHPASVDDFPLDGSINRVYNISLTNTGSYIASLQLHYEDVELNGNIETTMSLWRNTATWTKIGKLANDAINNSVTFTGITALTERWTLSDDNVTAIWKGETSSDWLTASNWKLNLIPSSGDIIQIGTETFTNQPSISTSITAKALTFGSAQQATLTIAAGGSLHVNGNLRGDWSTNAVHNIELGAQNLSVGGDIVLSDGVTSRTINLTASTGTLTTAGSLTQTGGANIVFSGAGTLNIAKHYNYTSGTFAPGASTVNYNGTEPQVVAGITYNNLTISKASGIAAISSPVIVIGNLSLYNSATLNVNAAFTVAGNVSSTSGTILNANSQTMSVGGNWALNGTFLSSLSSINFNGTGAQYLSAGSFNNVIINKVSGTLSAAGNIIINSDLTLTNGTFDLGAYTISRNTQGGTFTISNSSVLKLAGSYNFPSNFNNNYLSSTSTVEFYGSIAQTIRAITYGNLVLSNGGTNTKTISASITVSGNFTNNSGATFNGSTFTITVHGNFTNSGTFTAGTSTIVFAGGSSSSYKNITGATEFYNLIFTGYYAVTSGSPLSSTGYTHIIGGMNVGSNSIYIYGNTTVEGLYSTDGTTYYMGTQQQTIRLTGTISSPTFSSVFYFAGSIAPIFNSTASPTFINVTITNTAAEGIVTSVGWVVIRNFVIASGSTFNGGSLTHTVFGSLTNNGTILSSGVFNFTPSAPYTAGAVTVALGSGSAFQSTGTVNFGGTRQITITGAPTSFRNIMVSNTYSAGITPPAAWNITGDLTVGAGAILNAGINLSHTLAKSITVLGTLNGETSTFTMANTNNYQIAGTGSIYFYNLVISDSVTAVSNFDITGNFTDNGIFDPTGSVITFSGVTNSTISGSATSIPFETLVNNKTSASTILTKNVSGIITLSITSGTLDISSFSILQESTVFGSLEIENGGTLKIGSTNTIPIFTNGYTFNAGSTVDYAGTNQSISLQAYSNLALTNSGTKIFPSGTTYIGGNLTVGGTAVGDVTTNSTTINFNGTTLQTTPLFTYYNVTVNNTSGISLAGNSTVNNILTLSSGKLYTNSYKVILSPSATISGEVNGRYVIGNLETSRTVGTGASTFGGMGVTFAPGLDNLGTVTILRESGSGSSIVTGTSQGINRTWNIEVSGSQPIKGRSITFDWPADDDNNVNLSNAQLYRKKTASDPWEAVTLATDISGTRSINYTTDHFSIWTVTDTSNPLPVRLLSFTGKRITANNIELNWSTGQEKNNKGFEVEKSHDAKNFTSIGFVEGKERSMEMQSYTFIDFHEKDNAYYRVKQLDFNNNFEYGPTIYVPSATANLFQVYPNPINDKITIAGIDDQLQGTLTIKLFAQNGILLKTYRGTLEENSFELNNDVNKLLIGAYYLQIEAFHGNSGTKFLKE